MVIGGSSGADRSRSVTGPVGTAEQASTAREPGGSAGSTRYETSPWTRSSAQEPQAPDRQE